MGITIPNQESFNRLIRKSPKYRPIKLETILYCHRIENL